MGIGSHIHKDMDSDFSSLEFSQKVGRPDGFYQEKGQIKLATKLPETGGKVPLGAG
jgi:hypothetical protein